ncbi:MAG: hypothetical protein ACRD5L_12880, partial [Bryobacteraceae bacterium]
HLDSIPLELTLRKTIEPLANRFFADTHDTAALLALADAAVLARNLPFYVSLWMLQNRCFRLSETLHSSEKPDPVWMEAFRRLCDALKLRIGVT